MINKIINILSRTKIAFIGLLLVLIPIILLSYNNYKSIPGKSAVLQLTFNLSVGLMHDNIERELLRVEENIVKEIKHIEGIIGRDKLKFGLREFEKNYPVVKNAFIINAKGAAVSALASSGFSIPHLPLTANNPQIMEQIKTAEEEEFVKQDLTRAISIYKKALFNPFAGSINLLQDSRRNISGYITYEDSLILLSRIGRCYYKLKHYPAAIKQYEKIIEMDNGNYTLGDIPLTAAALQQIADVYKEMNDSGKYNKTLLSLYRYLLNNPWDPVDGNYKSYLKNIRLELENNKTTENAGFTKLKEYEDRLFNNVRELEILKNTFIERKIFQTTPEENTARFLQLNTGDSINNIYYYNIPGSSKTNSLIFGFNINTPYLIAEIIPAFLEKSNPGDEFITTVTDDKNNIVYSGSSDLINTFAGYKNYLAVMGLSKFLPGWQIALSDKEGKSVAQIVEDDKQQSLLLLGGTVFVMLIGIVIIIRSAIKEIELSQMKTDFVSNVSHELKTPLAMIRMFSETLDSDLQIDEKQRKEFSHIIKNESERLTQLVNNILDFSKIDQLKKQYYPKNVDLTGVVKNITNVFQAGLAEKGFCFNVLLPQPEIISFIDEEAFSRVLINLLNNAEKYSDTQKDIKVNLYVENGNAVISVEDKGIGIPRDEINKIFDKFYRSANSEHLAAGGTGLGLTIAKQIVEYHHGRIEVQSEEGKGSRFTVIIPAVKVNEGVIEDGKDINN